MNVSSSLIYVITQFHAEPVSLNENNTRTKGIGKYSAGNQRLKNKCVVFSPVLISDCPSNWGRVSGDANIDSPDWTAKMGD